MKKITVYINTFSRDGTGASWMTTMGWFLRAIILSMAFIFTGCGSEFEILFDENSGNDVNPAVFWSETDGTLNRIETDGTGETTVITSTALPLDLDIDSSGGKIFWAEYTGSAYRIRSAGLDGSNAVTVYNQANSLITGPLAIAIDRSKGTIFWNEYQDSSAINNIWTSVISSGTFSKTKWSNDLSHEYTYAACVDSINGKIYFTVNSYYDIGTAINSGNSGSAYSGTVSTANLEEEKYSITGPTADSVPLKGIAVDGEAGYVYFVTNTSHGVWPRNITRAGLSLQNTEVWIYKDVTDIQKIALDITNRKIYWTSETDNRIYRADLDSADSNMEVFLQLDSAPTGIAIPR